MIIEIFALLGLILCFAGYRLLKVFNESLFISGIFTQLYHNITLFFRRLCCFFADSLLVSWLFMLLLH